MCYLGASSPLLGRWWANHFRENVRVFSQQILITTQYSCKYKCFNFSSCKFQLWKSVLLPFSKALWNACLIHKNWSMPLLKTLYNPVNKVRILLPLNIKLLPLLIVCNYKVVDIGNKNASLLHWFLLLLHIFLISEPHKNKRRETLQD